MYSRHDAAVQGVLGDTFGNCAPHNFHRKVPVPVPTFHVACGYVVKDQSDAPQMGFVVCSEVCYKRVNAARVAVMKSSELLLGKRKPDGEVPSSSAPPSSQKPKL